MKKRFLHISIVAASLCMVSCIENDIPFPIVEASISSITVEHQCDADGNPGGGAQIDNAKRSVSLYVDDFGPLSDLRITSLTFTEGATLSIPDPSICPGYESFPRSSFESVEEGSDTRIDLSTPATIRLSTYQDYDWTISVKQIVRREIQLEGQLGDPVIDDDNQTVIVYVSNDKDLEHLGVDKFTLAGPHGKVEPDPMAAGTFDFSSARTFDVTSACDPLTKKWTVHVYPRESTVECTVFPMAATAHIGGTMQSGLTPVVSYRIKGEDSWNTLDQSLVEVTGPRYSATIRHILPSTDYQCKVTTAVAESGIVEFTTAPALPLPGGDFDHWHSLMGASKRELWNPWAEGEEPYWDTGNKGASTVGASNSQPTTETCNGKGMAAFLESRYIVIKFAAGNIFTGRYVDTDGTNGIVDFGRPFDSYPTGLRVNYKFKTSTINRSADDDYKHLIGRPDSCQIFIALADWDKPFQVRTNPARRSVFSPDDPGVIAFGQITLGDDVPDWKQQTIPLEYYATNRKPKYIVVVASASKFGDYFTGGEGTKLWVDNFELLYE